MQNLISKTPQERLSDIKKLGNTPKSITEINKLLLDFPNFVSGWIALGLIYRQSGDHQLALNTFQKAIKIEPRNTKVKLELAAEQLHYGQIKECSQNIQEVLAINPNHEIAFVKQGELNRSQNKRRKALASFQKALDLNPQSFLANFNVAVELRELGALKRAEQHFIQALEYNANHFHTLIHMGILQRKKQRYNLALEYFQKAITIEPTKIEPYLSRLDILCHRKQFKKAKNQINQLLENFPNSISALLKAGVTYRQLGDRKAALNTFQEAIKLAPNNQNIKLELSAEQFYQGQIEECRKNIQEILEINPKQGGAIIRLGELYRKENNRPKALASFQKALDLNPQSFLANFNVAVELRELGDFEAAEQHFIKALEYNKNHFYALIHMGILQRKKQKYNLALEYFQKAITIEPTKIEPHLAKIDVSCDVGRFHEAENRLKVLQQKYPEEYIISIFSGHFARKLGQEEKALEWFCLAQKQAKSKDQKLEAKILKIETLTNLKSLENVANPVETILVEFPDDLRSQMLQGLILEKKLNLIEAAKVYQNVLATNPNHLQVSIKLARVYSQSAQIPASINLLEETYQILGANLNVFIELGSIYQALENWDLASQWYEKAYQKYPYNHQGYSHLANLMFIQGETESAIKLLQKAQAALPYSLPINIRSIDFQIRLGNLGLSHKLLKKALKQFPNNVELLWQLCRVHMQQGDYVIALETLDKISTDNLNWIRQTEQLRANIYFCQYDYQKAEQHFRQAIASVPLATTERNGLATILMLTGRITEARQELKIATEKLNLKTPPGQSLVPLRGHAAMVTNELRINPPLMTKLLATQQKIGAAKIFALGNLLAQEPNYLGTALYLARELRLQGIFEKVRQVLPQTTTNTPIIPRKIVQFWDQPQPPKEIQRICQSWSNLNPEYEYTLFSLKTAVAFIQEHYDQKVLKAFANCDHPATQADFFRLAYLNKMGGFYVDADDLCRQSLDNIVNLNPELVILQEDFACIGNNFLGCIPGQSMIQTAFAQAVDNLSDYCNESPWFKTGPGLITTVVCGGLVPYLTQKDYRTWPRLLVLTQAQLRKIINQHIYLPYKQTTKNWQYNAYHRKIKNPLIHSN
ncbi:mannosyltransferase OCH1-like enzyme [Xenococcus sp. PCC 7305]|uniref:tetratricopeptide repeat protein n=1 Tax=Xenococcus sp. PCC 7305 TaxID=102125 RepID=UPI0002ACE23A|nr:tetratricopeptide repeat protein [Xenococcus sp. PCC 7305]ELS03825.1 mannosyltransferase OCH1-like enzyme [Xenococcus sp. PCC 7305]